MCHARSRLVWPRERRASLASLPVCRMPMTATLEPIPPWGLSQSRLITVPCSSILVPRTTSSSRAAHALSVAARLTSPRSETTKLTTPGPILQLLQPQNRCNDNMLRIDASSCSPEPELIDSPAHRIRVFASSEPADLSGSNIPAHQEEASSAPPARSQDAQHNLPPPAACWRFQEHGAREHIQCTIKAHLGKRSTLRRASTGGDDLSPLRCAPFGGEGRSQSMKHLEAWSKLQELQRALAGVMWDTDMDTDDRPESRLLTLPVQSRLLTLPVQSQLGKVNPGPRARLDARPDHDEDHAMPDHARRDDLRADPSGPSEPAFQVPASAYVASANNLKEPVGAVPRVDLLFDPVRRRVPRARGGSLTRPPLASLTRPNGIP